MRISKLNLDKETIDSLGLKEFNSNRLNNTFSLVGKNGSGKSRYLLAIQKKLRNLEITDLINGEIEFLPSGLNQIISKFIGKDSVLEAFQILKQVEIEKRNNPNSVEIANKLAEAQRKFNVENRKNPLNLGANQNLEHINNSIRAEIKKRIKIIKPSDFRILKESFDIKKNPTYNFQQIIESTTEDLEFDEFSMISESALSYLQRLPHKLAFDDIDTKGDEKKFRGRVAYKRFTLLSKLIDEFLGKKLEWKSKTSNVDEFDDHISIKATGFWTIDGREFNYSSFSEGEKVLFTYALLLFLLNTNPRIKFKESIIIIDEPELNLHPKAQIKLIESLQELIRDEGQLIIATHSLSIVSNLEYGSIHLVRNSQMYSPSSTIPFDSVDDLMGFDEHYNKIVEFLVSTPSWAMTNFMAQCFDDPEVFEQANENDPQLEIFKNLILSKSSLRILDFGSGKGRLLEKIKESDETWNRIESYDCFDIEEDYNELIKLKGAKNIFNDLEKIPNEKYDLVILVNVLHEIHIKNWAKSLNKIKKILKPNGFFAIIEDTNLPVGELPNEHGFLILDKEEMKLLLGNEINFLTPNIKRYRDRIICGVIQSSFIRGINKKLLISTLEKLKVNSLNAIMDYRKVEEKNINLGRLYALKSNLYVNSELAMKYLNDN
ncbi:AAA family ATPase [Vitellibacter sp. q18]|nr:AAA family ATPase [Aequorivita lutea]